MIICKADLKLRWTTHCFVCRCVDNAIGNNDYIILTISPAVTLSARDHQKSSKRLNKGSESSLCWNEYKTKSDNKNTTNKFRFCPESNFVGVNRLFVSVYSNQNTASRKFKTKRFYSPKGIIDNYNVIVHLKNVYDPAIDLYIK